MFISKTKLGKIAFATLAVLFSFVSSSFASEMDLNIPFLSLAEYNFWGLKIDGETLLMGGMGICLLGMIFGLWEFFSIKKMPAHDSMLKVSETIYATCTTYMKQQAKLLFVLELFIEFRIFICGYIFYIHPNLFKGISCR